MMDVATDEDVDVVAEADVTVDEVAEIIAISSAITTGRWVVSIAIVDSPVVAPTAKKNQL